MAIKFLLTFLLVFSIDVSARTDMIKVKLESKAIAYEKKKNYIKAIKNYSYLISSIYKTSHKKIFRFLKDPDYEDKDAPKVNKEIFKYYAKKAELYGFLYEQKFKSLSPKLRKFIRARVNYYAKICETWEESTKLTEQASSKIAQLDKELEQSVYQSAFFGLASYLTWQDPLVLASPSNGDLDLLATTEGNCFGGGWRKYNHFYEFNVEACMIIANANVGSFSESVVDYYQENVFVWGILIGPSALYKPSFGGSAIGVQVPLMYRKGKYETPNTSYSFKEGTSLITAGILIEGQWRLKNFAISSKIGKLDSLSSSMISLGVNYEFN